jgi:hypothetical protein
VALGCCASKSACAIFCCPGDRLWKAPVVLGVVELVLVLEVPLVELDELVLVEPDEPVVLVPVELVEPVPLVPVEVVVEVCAQTGAAIVAVARNAAK